MQHAYRVPARHLPHLATNILQNSDVIVFAIIYIYKNVAIYIKQLNVNNKSLEWVSHGLDHYNFRTIIVFLQYRFLRLYNTVVLTILYPYIIPHAIMWLRWNVPEATQFSNCVRHLKINSAEKHSHGITCPVMCRPVLNTLFSHNVKVWKASED